jgi:hypothetical protein
MLHLTYANAVNCYTNNLPCERKDDSLIILRNNASEILNICDFGLQEYTSVECFLFWQTLGLWWGFRKPLYISHSGQWVTGEAMTVQNTVVWCYIIRSNHEVNEKRWWKIFWQPGSWRTWRLQCLLRWKTINILNSIKLKSYTKLQPCKPKNKKTKHILLVNLLHTGTQYIHQ